MRSFALLLGVALSFLTTSAAAQNCDGFTDVLASDIFCTDITWVKSKAITQGCGGGGTKYCPNDFVTREQMAAFLHRLGDVTVQPGGNAFGGLAALGTTDNNAFDLFVDNQLAVRVQPVVDPVYGFNPNVINGPYLNSVAVGVAGATIAGGGGCCPGTGGSCTSASGNTVTGEFGTVGGGSGNTA